MVRGRRKCVKSRMKPEDDGMEDVTCAAPKKKDSKLSKGVKGKLSHSSPQVADITKFLTPVTKDNLVVVKQEDDAEDTQTSFNRSSLHQQSRPCSPDPKQDDTDCKKLAQCGVSTQTPHKIQLCREVMPLSPSTALSQLRISLSPKKAVKSRRRLNPSQTVNQQTPQPFRVNASVPAKTNHTLTEYFPVRRSVRKTKRTVLEELQRDLEEAVIAGKEEGLEVHNFEGKGRGIVATRLFCKGEYVVEYAGELIDIAEAKDREKSYAQDQNTGCYMYYFKHKNVHYCVDATAESGRLGRLVNHSRSGNLLTKTVVIMNQPHLVLIAKEDIQPGEEVTYDYGDRSKESIRYHPWLLT